MRVFLTGGTGFIGSHVLNSLLAEGHSVVAMQYPGTSPVIPLDGEPEWIEGTLEDDYSAILKTCDALVHLAAVGVNPQSATWDNCFRWNVMASLKFWQQAVRAGVRRFVICGSCFEYGRSAERYDFIPTDAPLEPTGAYHASKAAATMAAMGMAVDFDLELLVVRPFHVYGEGEPLSRFWPALKSAALSGRDFNMTFGEQIRDFIAVEDIAARIADLVVHAELNSGYPVIKNLGNGNPVTLRHFAEEWWEKWSATGHLNIGVIPYRENETMRYVAKVDS
jgi:nucleoside-diphosphate-sugar epimerase